MPVLTNYLPVHILDESQQERSNGIVTSIRSYRSILKTFQEAFNNPISNDSDVAKRVISQESKKVLELWEISHDIPEEFAKPCIGRYKKPHNYLADLAVYPSVKLGSLKQMADDLGFIIFPIEYTDMGKIISTYKKKSYSYGVQIDSAYDQFADVVKNSESLIGVQQLYMLGPISLYDPWEEIIAEERIKKYYSKKLSYISAFLEMSLPVQRNLYLMTNQNSKDLRQLSNDLRQLRYEMEQNINSLSDSIRDCHNKLDWVMNLNQTLSKKLESSQQQVADLRSTVGELEYKLYCLLDPIIFSIDSDIDISAPDYDDSIAKIGLCFGPEMPFEFFVNNGMTIFNDTKMEKVTFTLTL